MRDPNANGKDWPPAGWDTPYKRPPYPSTWARLHGKGRVFYTSMGHREDVWENKMFHSLIIGGMFWALGKLEADVTPNITTATPKYMTMPA